MLAGDELAALSDEQVIDLIFSAGFSTAAEVSDISGRGVGMDVVRATVERIGGRASVTSRLGVGTTVRLDLPMNIAMSRIMVVEAGGQMLRHSHGCGDGDRAAGRRIGSAGSRTTRGSSCVIASCRFALSRN